MVAAGLAVALLVGACSARKAPTAPASTTAAGAQTSAPAAASASASRAVAAVLSLSPVAGSTAVDPVQPIKVGVRGGEISQVTLINDEGTAVKGALSTDRTSWASAEPLGYSKTYKLTAVARNADGSTATKISSFTTVTPAT